MSNPTNAPDLPTCPTCGMKANSEAAFCQPCGHDGCRDAAEFAATHVRCLNPAPESAGGEKTAPFWFYVAGATPCCCDNGHANSVECIEALIAHVDGGAVDLSRFRADVCEYMCPDRWRSAEPQPHHELCRILSTPVAPQPETEGMTEATLEERIVREFRFYDTADNIARLCSLPESRYDDAIAEIIEREMCHVAAVVVSQWAAWTAAKGGR